jgi:hypothetical protein
MVPSAVVHRGSVTATCFIALESLSKVDEMTETGPRALFERGKELSTVSRNLA